MFDHLHVITDSARSSADTLRFINGIIGRRVIDYLKQRGYESSLLKLRRDSTNTNYLYSFWDSNVRLLFTEKMLMERVHYTHQNPVRAGLVERAEDYHWSSVHIWNGKPREDEPLLMNLITASNGEAVEQVFCGLPPHSAVRFSLTGDGALNSPC